MTDRARLLSNSKFHKKNFIINTLLKNDYPVEFIFEIISTRLKYLFSKRSSVEIKLDNSNDNNSLERVPWFFM